MELVGLPVTVSPPEPLLKVTLSPVWMIPAQPEALFTVRLSPVVVNCSRWELLVNLTPAVPVTSAVQLMPKALAVNKWSMPEIVPVVTPPLNEMPLILAVVPAFWVLVPVLPSGPLHLWVELPKAELVTVPKGLGPLV